MQRRQPQLWVEEKWKSARCTLGLQLTLIFIIHYSAYYVRDQSFHRLKCQKIVGGKITIS